MADVLPPGFGVAVGLVPAPRSPANPMMLGIDVGGTKTAAVALDAAGAVVHEVQLPTELGTQGVLATVATAIKGIEAQANLGVAGFASIGIGIPGAVDAATGRVSHAVNLAVEDLDLAALVAAHIDRTVYVENDVKAAALGAYHTLGPQVRSMAYLNLGTGLAAGLIVNGELWRGARGVAGEIGHIPIADGPECPCGQHGCLELYASGSALARLWPSRDAPPPRALFDAADRGDAEAIRLRRGFVESVASAVRILVLTADMELVVIGGGISNLGDRLLTALRAALDAEAAKSPFLASQELPPRVRLVPRGMPVAAVGAAFVGFDRGRAA